MPENPKYAQVIVDIPELDTRTFSYLIPEEIKESVKVGIPVLVPFGHQGMVNAYIVGFGNYLPEGIKAKSIYEIIDTEPVFDLEYLKFLEWVSTYYCCSLQTVLATALPLNFLSKAKRMVSFKGNKINFDSLDKNQQKIIEIIADKKEISANSLQKKVKLQPSKFYEALRKLKKTNIVEINNIIDSREYKPKIEKFIKAENQAGISKEDFSKNKRYLEILEILKKSGSEIKLSEFLKNAKTTSNTLKKLEESGFIKIFEKEIYRNPLFAFDNIIKQDFLELNSCQKEALERIKKAMEEDNPAPLLLFGVTGSGKTEVYFHAIRETLDKDKTVIFLAPEIALASQSAKRMAERFGIDNLAIWHSGLSDGERFDVWQKTRNNKLKIIIGARSAIFAPIKNLGLIIIDEEHESSYKQTSPNPRYNAKDVAFERAKRSGGLVILGSATPDVATYYKTLNTNRVLTLPERFGSKNLAGVAIIDMKQEMQWKNRIFSRTLQKALERSIQEKKQSILLINRRGFSTYTFCGECGHVSECAKCSIPLILHKTNNKLRCHYCNLETNNPTICPECGSSVIKNYGLGTQKVEEEFRLLFPQATAARLDGDIMSKKNAHIEILDKFSKGEIDVLIGTQMVAKGLDIPNVTLVGVLMTDSLFSMPDFRAAERGFQLLTQVAGRAGRGDFKGVVYYQTYTPEFLTLNTAKEQDYISFYYAEIQERYEFSYPPYSQIIRFIISSKNETMARKFADDVAYKLNLLTDSRGIKEKLEILGPASCIISKIKDEYRFQIIIKNRLEDNGHGLIASFIKKLNVPENIKFLTDVDPSDML